VNSPYQVNVRCWRHIGSASLEDMILGLDEKVVMDRYNILSSEEYDSCLAIVCCRVGKNTYAHLAQVIGLYKGDPASIWDLSPNTSPREGEAYEIKAITHIHHVPDAIGELQQVDQGFATHQRIAVMHYLLDMG
jgi:hypothetical protein